MYYPHMRGWSYQNAIVRPTLDVLPAHAGVILIYHKEIEKWKSITRTCGGDPSVFDAVNTYDRYYPHMRGWS